MRDALNRYLSVHTEDELLAERGQRLQMLILVMSLADLLTLLKDVIFGTVRPEFLLAEMLAFAIFGVLYWYTRQGRRWPPYVLLAFVVFFTPAIFDWNPTEASVITMAVSVATVPLIAPSWLCIPVAVGEVILLYVISFLGGTPLPDPMVNITLGVLGALSWLASSSLENALREARRNASALAESNRDLQASRALLETHARELERRSVSLEASAAVGRAATSILETDQLIHQVVDLIRQRFGFYYVGLFLVDETGQWATLRAGGGDAGQALLERGHRLRVGADSIIGWSIAHSEARVALDAEGDAVRLDRAELPGTRSEAALPLRSRGQVLGALTVHSSEPAAFDQDTTVVLQTMADQVAVALDNARLFSEAQEALQATRRAYGELSREAWTELLRARPGMGYHSDEHDTIRVAGIPRSEIERALQKRPTDEGGDAAGKVQHPLAVPIEVRGKVLGVLDTYKPGSVGEWTPSEISLVKTLAEQVGMALESARLYNEAQRRAARERLVSEITDKMRRAVDMDALIQTTIREMAAAVDAPYTFVQLSSLPETEQDEDES